MFPPLRHIPPSSAARPGAAVNFLKIHGGAILCGLFLLAGLVLAGDYGILSSEETQRQNARANWDYILGRADRIETFYYHDRVYGVAFELPLLLAEGFLGLTDNHQSHRLRLTLTHLFFILGGYFCYRLAYHIFNNRLIALLALLIFLLHPRIYAHSFFNSKDLPFLALFAITLYLLERAFRRDTLGAFALLGVAVGLLTNLRIMGIMLFPAVIALRGLDLFYAADWPERKGVLRSGGLFILAAGLTTYALAPYAWTNPVDYLTTNLDLTVNHPTVVAQLFRGDLILSNALPPHYNAIWFAITTPPPLLLLGLVGIAVAAARIGRRPGAALGNGRRRFLGLLLAVFLLPPLAVALLGSNQYHDWRHLYFLYAPFSLLAALGGGWLLAALAGQGRRRAGLYALAGLGLGLTLLQMAQIHPWQHGYFNFLVDRTTPERLGTQYELDRWKLAQGEGLAYLLARHPGESLVARAAELQPGTLPAAARQLLQREILPAAARRRLRPATGGRRADYELIYREDFSQPDLAFNAAYRRRLYNNTLILARPLKAGRMTAAAVAAYGELYRQAREDEPIIRADYNVYRRGQRLTFVRENCPPDSPDAWLGVKLIPHYPEARLLGSAIPGSYAIFHNHAVRLGNVCLAVIRLPDYARGDLILSQRNAGSSGQAGLPLWAEFYSLARPGLRELIADYRRQGAAAAIRSPFNGVQGERRGGAAGAFDVFIDQAAGRNRLLYAKGECSPVEYETRVTLHIYPANPADLPARYRDGGHENRDFALKDYGGRPGGECLAAFPLPDYPIAAIHTGQAGRWNAILYPPDDPELLRAAYAALAERQPDLRANFDLYWQDNRLIYLRETCAAADTAANFFLHIIPADAADLPAERQDAGFANLDFVFERWGGLFDGKCLAAVALPDYGIAVARTGQYVAGQGELWAAELAGGR